MEAAVGDRSSPVDWTRDDGSSAVPRLVQLAATSAALARTLPPLLHDLRAPLNAVALHLALLEQSARGASGTDEIAEGAAEAAQQFARFKQAFEAVARELSFRESSEPVFSLADVLRDVHGSLEGLARRNGVTLDLALPEEEAFAAGRDVSLLRALVLLAAERILAIERGGRLTLALVPDAARHRVVLSGRAAEDVSDQRLLARTQRSTTDSDVERLLASALIAECAGVLALERVPHGTRLVIELPRAPAPE
jgi:hypothetical protein